MSERCEDLISREKAIYAVADYIHNVDRAFSTGLLSDEDCKDAAESVLEGVPSAQSEVKEIGYAECADAMLKMWIDNVLTDGEYNRIMDKLNAHWAERREE